MPASSAHTRRRPRASRVPQECASPARWKPGPNQVPVPCVATPTTARVAKGFVLQPFGVQAHGKSEDDELVTVTRYQMRHWSSEPHMAMQPKTAGHCMPQPVAAARKL